MLAIRLAPASDGDLASAAIAGDGMAFAALYDRHERRAFNLAYRITGSRDDAADATQEAFLKLLARLPRLGDRELDFGSYLLTAVRHASYDVMARSRRADPTGELPESARPVGAAAAPPPEDEPDRNVLLAASQEEIRAANAALAPRQREALALRELEGLSYDEIAALMEMNRNSVAQLISRARIALRDALRHRALQTIPPVSKACEKALGLITIRDDGQRERHDDAGWLDAHLATCERCVLGREAMAEAGASYRIWAPVAAFEALRRETIAQAGERLGHDWSEIAAQATGLGAGGRNRGHEEMRPRRGPRRVTASRGGYNDGAASKRTRRDGLAVLALAAFIMLALLATRTANGERALPIAVDSRVAVGVDPAEAAPVRTAAPAKRVANPRRTRSSARRRGAARMAPGTRPIAVTTGAPARPIGRSGSGTRSSTDATPVPPPPPPATPEQPTGDTGASSPPLSPPPSPSPPPPPPADPPDVVTDPPPPPPPPPPPVGGSGNLVIQPPPPPPPSGPKRIKRRPGGGSSVPQP